MTMTMTTTTTTMTKPEEEGERWKKKRVHQRDGVGWFSKRAAPLVKISSGELAAKYTVLCERGWWLVCSRGRVKVLVRLSARVLYMYMYMYMYVRTIL